MSADETLADSRARFSATAGDYQRHRPSYPPALIDWIAATAGLRPQARVADVGCGTGIFSRLLAGRGYTVIGIDPNLEMLERARESGGGVTYRRGEAAATGLPPSSVDLAAAAQAFHWFDLAATMAELASVLVPGGWCAAVWNVRQSTPLLDEYERLLRATSRDYARIARPEATLAAIRRHPGVADLRVGAFLNPHRLDRDGLIGRAHSASYVAHGVGDLAAFDRELAAIFARHQSAGEVELAYRAVALMWRLPRPA